MNLKDIYTLSERNIKLFLKEEGKVLSKFVKDGIYGILSAKSINISDMARQPERRLNTSARYIYKKLDRAIGDYDLGRIVERAKGYQMNMITEDTLIYIDGTDVVKKYGRKFECLCRVPDGSDKREIKYGYPMISAIGLRGDEIIPLALKIYSYNSEDFSSQNSEYIELIHEIYHKGKGKGIYVMDRGFDEFVMESNMVRIKNLISLLFIALVVLCRISELRVEISKVRDVLIKRSKRVYKIPQKIRFFLYMLGDGLSEVLKIILRRLKNLIREDKKIDKNQLLLSFAEDL